MEENATGEVVCEAVVREAAAKEALRVRLAVNAMVVEDRVH